jgi:hypothetical protein
LNSRAIERSKYARISRSSTASFLPNAPPDRSLP